MLLHDRSCLQRMGGSKSSPFAKRFRTSMQAYLAAGKSSLRQTQISSTAVIYFLMGLPESFLGKLPVLAWKNTATYLAMYLERQFLGLEIVVGDLVSRSSI